MIWQSHKHQAMAIYRGDLLEFPKSWREGKDGVVWKARRNFTVCHDCCRIIPDPDRRVLQEAGDFRDAELAKLEWQNSILRRVVSSLEGKL